MRILRFAALEAAAVVFAVYLIKSGGISFKEAILPFLALAGFTWVFIMSVPGFVRALAGGTDIEIAHEEKTKNKARTFIIILIAALILHAGAIALGVLLFKWINAGWRSAGFFETMRTAWMKSNTDVQHYLDIAEHWYVKEGNEALLMVFFPMFPLLIRCTNFITGDSFVSAQLINAAATALTAGLTYIALLPVLQKRRAVCCAFIYLLLPGAIFMNSPMTEPLFMLFSVCTFIFLQRKKLILAGVFTALAGFTRSLGVLLAVSIALIGIGDIVRLRREGKPVCGAVIRLLIALAVSTLGTLGYLAINYSVHGDAFKFLEFQWSNWHQKACPFFDTPRYMLERLIESLPSGTEKMLGLWLPQLIAIFFALAVMGLAAKRLPASYMAFFLPYFAVAIGCTWLLSSVRYLSAALPVSAAIAAFCGKRSRSVPVFAALAVLYTAYAYMYMLRWGIY